MLVAGRPQGQLRVARENVLELCVSEQAIITNQFALSCKKSAPSTMKPLPPAATGPQKKAQ